MGPLPYNEGHRPTISLTFTGVPIDISETPERAFGAGASTPDGFRDLTMGGGNRDIVAIHATTHTPGPAKYTPRDFEKQQREAISQHYLRSVSGKLQMEEHRLPPSEVGPWEAHKVSIIL